MDVPRSKSVSEDYGYNVTMAYNNKEFIREEIPFGSIVHSSKTQHAINDLSASSQCSSEQIKVSSYSCYVNQRTN